MSYKDFLFGGISGMTASAVVHPLDTIKTRIQLYSEAHRGQNAGAMTTARRMLAEEGFFSLYKGIDSALMRQAVYGTARLGLYKYAYHHIEESKGRVSLMEKALCSLTAGVIGSTIGNPIDLALVRFQSDGFLPPAERRNYKHIFDALARMWREEGPRTLFRGVSGNISRGMAMNLGSIACFDELKERLNRMMGTRDANQARVVAAGGAGFVCAYLSLPFDNVKVKLQKMRAGPDGVLPYRSFLDCLRKSIFNESVLGLYAGHQAYAMKVVPHAILVLLVQDALHLTFGNKKSPK